MSVHRRSRRSLLWTCLALPALLAACDEGSCFLFVLHSVDVRLVDSETNAPIVAEGARVAVEDGAFVEELAPGGDGSFRGVEDRPGRYTITASSPGYDSWVQADILIAKTGCNTEPTSLTASLTRVR